MELQDDTYFAMEGSDNIHITTDFDEDVDMIDIVSPETIELDYDVDDGDFYIVCMMHKIREMYDDKYDLDMVEIDLKHGNFDIIDIDNYLKSAIIKINGQQTK